MADPEFWILVGSLFLLGTVLSGFYPAIVLSSFKPVAVLKGKLIRSSGGEILRKSLVVFQFSASVFLIVGSLIVYQQLQFMKHQDLGLTIDDTLVLQGPGVGVMDSLVAERLDGFKAEVERIAGVKSMTASSAIPGKEIYWASNIRLLTSPTTENLNVSGSAIDQDFIKSYGVKILAGRDFDHSMTHDDKRVILNLALCERLGFKDPKEAIGKMVVFSQDTLEVMGVSENFHQMSLKNEVAPLVMGLGYSVSYFSLKVETDNYQSIIASLQEPWNRFFPGNPIDYFFLDEFFNRQYDKDNRFGQVFTLFTFLGILIASLGLFGLASFMALQRTKEIGIRKVLGSSVSGIVVLLSRSFMQPVLIANLIAWPIAWWIMDRWLQSFPYRISINPLYFIAAGMLVVIIAFISVSSQTLKAAMTQPANTLKHE
jgi:putative ABC transport system permease protein